MSLLQPLHHHLSLLWSLKENVQILNHLLFDILRSILPLSDLKHCVKELLSVLMDVVSGYKEVEEVF